MDEGVVYGPSNLSLRKFGGTTPNTYTATKLDILCFFTKDNPIPEQHRVQSNAYSWRQAEL